MKRFFFIIFLLYFSRLYCNDFNNVIELLKLNNKEEIFITQMNKGVFIYIVSIDKIDNLTIERKDKMNKSNFIIYDDKLRLYEENNGFYYYYPIFDNPPTGKKYEYEIIQKKNIKKIATNIGTYIRELDSKILIYENGKLLSEQIPQKELIYFKINYLNLDYGPYDISVGFGFDFFYPGIFNFLLFIKYNPFSRKYTSVIGAEYYPFNDKNVEFLIFSKYRINPFFTIEFQIPFEFNILSSMVGINLEGRLYENFYYKSGLFLDFLIIPSFLISLTWKIGFKYYFGYF